MPHRLAVDEFLILLFSECSNEVGILSNFNDEMRFSQTDAFKSGEDFYDARRIIFKKNFAWCLLSSQSSITNTPYNDWAKIDLAQKYLIYGIQVAGYLKRSTDPLKRMYIAKMFKFRYSLDDKVKRDLEGRKVSRNGCSCLR